MKLKKLIFRPMAAATPHISTTPTKSDPITSAEMRTLRKKTSTSRHTPAKERKVVRGPSTSMSCSRSAKMTFSPVASYVLPLTGTLRTPLTKASRFCASSRRAPPEAVMDASRPTVPSRSRKRSIRTGSASCTVTGFCTARSSRTCRRRSRCTGSSRLSTESGTAATISRMMASFSSCWRGTTDESVSHESINLS